MVINWGLYRAAGAADNAYQKELERCYGRLNAIDMRYRMDDHPDARCQAARIAFREATEAFRAHMDEYRASKFAEFGDGR